MRLFIVVEGQTEEAFVNRVLAPHLHRVTPLGHLDVRSIIVQTSRDAQGRKRRGGGSWGKWVKDLKRLIAEPRGRFTTMFDLYGLPEDFPRWAECSSIADTARRADALENAMVEAVGDRRFIPYIQRHEFEALVLAALGNLEKLLDGDDLGGLQRLWEDIAGAAPEDVNDGTETAPSKRLKRFISSYSKTLHGPLALEDAGLEALRRACPRFDAWVAKLEEIVAA
jgi:hypothetical protein